MSLAVRTEDQEELGQIDKDTSKAPRTEKVLVKHNTAGQTELGYGFDAERAVFKKG